MFYRSAAICFNKYSGRESAAAAPQVETKPAVEPEEPKTEEKAE
jgi:hypothetical protein